MDELNTIFTIQFQISLMFTMVFLVSWYTIQRERHILLWFLLSLCSCVNLLLIANADLFPDLLIHWVVVNATSLIMQALAIAGLRSRAGIKPFPAGFIVYFLAVEFLVYFFTFVYPHIGLRMVFIPYSHIVMCLACIWVLLCGQDRVVRPAEIGLIVFYILATVSRVAAGTVALLQGAESIDEYMALYLKINLLTMPVLHAGLGMFAVVLISDDLLLRVKKLEGLLPICTYCKNIRDDSGIWSSMEKYISARTDTKFSHGVCPKCRLGRVADLKPSQNFMAERTHL